MLLRRSCCFGFLVFLVFLGFSAAAAVFLQKLEADSVLRRRRANSGFLEELKQGNLERECIEEICDYEEAREVFENDDKTRQFWLTYERRDPCLVNPCQNNGTCVYVGTSYECQCSEGFEGRYCQTVFEDSLKCLYQNGLCDQFCDGSGERRRCSCSEGYQLAEDGRSCIAQVEFPCGQLVPEEPGLNQTDAVQTRVVGGNHCPPGECPRRVSLAGSGPVEWEQSLWRSSGPTRLGHHRRPLYPWQQPRQLDGGGRGTEPGCGRRYRTEGSCFHGDGPSWLPHGDG